MGEHSRDSRRLADDPIAIVGVSCLFPMAGSYREYWQNIIDGTDCTSEVPASRWRLDDYYDPDPAAPDKTYSKRGGFVPDVEFSPVDWGIPPNQLDVTSTTQTLSLGVARELLRNADAIGSSWYDSARTGVVLGVAGPIPLMHPLSARLSTPVLKEVVRAAGLSESDAQEIADRYVRAFAPWEENSFPGLLPNVVAGRIANRLDLGGLNSTVDAACAASLSAVRMAIAELTDRRADTMIAGGVDMENSIFGYLSFSKVGALSRTDRVSPLSDQADGTLVGEGIGMLALRRLADAERDGNRIYAVIRGIGSSSDGRAKSIYAPRAEGQRVALRRAYEDADCLPSSVELFEAHATGTAVGDRTELTALHELLSENSPERHFAALGSVKSQIGHTKGAAGAASLIKLALSLYHKTLPPTINVERPNSYLDFTSAPFYVNVTTRPWIRDPHRPVRRAAASAMGFGGTNFHIVVEEHDGRRSAVRNRHRTARAHLWHAPDPAALAELLNSGAPSADGGPVPADHARVGFVATGEQSAAELRALAAERILANPGADSWSVPKGVFYRRRALPELRVGALFAGQGSQYLNMGLEAALNVPPVGETFDEANAVFAGQGTRLAAVVFPPPVADAELRQAQEAMLRQTEYAQPAIGALSAGQFRFLRELGLECASFAGHSFGELTALWAAGALTDTDYFRLAAARGAAMAARPGTSDSGAMASIMAGREQVTEILTRSGGDAIVCNHNAPDQVVVGGGTAAVQAIVSACTEQGITARMLPVSAAFHTPYVAHAEDAFRAAVDAARIGPPTAPVHANSPGAGYGPDPAANAQTLAAQLLRPVEFVAAVRAMHAAGVTVFVEFGPKQVLTGLVRRILSDDAVTAIATDAGPIGDSDFALKQAAVQLAVLGAPVTQVNRYDEAEIARVAPKGMTVTLSGGEYVPPARRAAYAAGLTDGFQISPPAAPAQVPAELPALFPPAGPPGNGTAPHASDGRAETTQYTGTVQYAEQYTDPAQYTEQYTEHYADPAQYADTAQYTEAHLAEEQPPMTAHPRAERPAGEDPAAQHLALHSRYLDSQLQVAEALLRLVAEHGLDHPRLPQIAETVKDQSVAIGSAHARAAEVLARLTELELGAAAGGYAPAEFPVAPAPAAYAQAPAAPAPAAPVPAAPAELPGRRYAIDPVPVPPLAPMSAPTAPTSASNGAPAQAAAPAPAPAPGPAAVSGPTIVSQPAAANGAPVPRPAPAQAPVPQAAAPAPAPGPAPASGPTIVSQPAAANGAPVPRPAPAQAPVPQAAAPAPAPGPAPASGPTIVSQSTVDPGALRTALIAIVAEKTGYPPDLIDPTMDLEAELGIDSIKRVQVVGTIQEQFTGLPTVGPEQLSELRTLDQLVDFMTGAAGDADPKALSPAAEPSSAQVSPARPAPAPRYPVELVDLPAIDLLTAPYPDDPVAVVAHHGGADGTDPKALSPAAEPSSAQVSPARPAPAPRYPVELVDLPAIDLLTAPYPDDPVAVVVHHGGADGAAIASTLAARGWTVRQVGNPLDAGQTLATALTGQVNAVVMVVTDGPQPSVADAMSRLAEVVLLAKHAQAPLTEVGGRNKTARHRAAFVAVTRLDGSLGRAGTAAPETALLGGAAGVVKTLAIEAPELFCRALDIDPGLDPGTAAAVLLDELFDAATDTVEVGVDAARARRTITPSRYHLGGPPPSAADMSTVPDPTVLADTVLANTVLANTVSADDMFVVTGGARGITARCVAELAALRPAEFILLGRTELTAEPAWAAGVADADLKPAVITAARAAGNRPTPREIEQRYADLAAQREIRATLAGLTAAGATARYLAVDVTDARAVRDALAGPLVDRRVTGVIHGAGVLADAFLADKTPAQIERVLRPKLGGLSAVLAAIDPDQLRHLVLFTSVAGLLGNAGQADYAAANEALCRFAASWKHRHPGQHVVAIDWGAWDAGMVTPSVRAALSARGVPLLDPATGARAFAEQFSGSRAAQSRVLIGAKTALSAARPVGGGAFTARRELAGIESDEVILAHRIGPHEVLPATFALGWMINVAERAYPGAVVVRVRDFQVFRGVVFDGSQAAEYWTGIGAATEADGRLIARTTVQSASYTAQSTSASGRLVPHYGATIELAAGPEPGGQLPVPVPGAGAGNALTFYTSAICFHAPRLQGMRDILEFTDRRLALRCRLADAAVAGGAFTGALHSPVLTDLLLQGSSVLGGRIRERSLPLAITTADYYAPLPDDEDFFVVLDQLRAAGAGVSVDATATDRSGRVLVRFTGITLVPTPGMAAKFAEAVEHWRKELELA